MTWTEGRRLLNEVGGASDQLSVRLRVLEEARPGLGLRVEAQALASGGEIAGDLQGADVEALVFLVMMQASRSAQDDLKAIMNDIEATNAAKARWRESMQELGAARSALEAEIKSPCPPLATTTDLETVLPILLTAYGLGLDHELDGLTAELDSQDQMSELSEMETLRLQEAMDRRTRMMTVLANVMKKVADTSQGIVNNMK